MFPLNVSRIVRSPNVLAVLLYSLVAVAFSWPIPLHLSDRLPGSVDGDTGVYVWNLWVFRHELVHHGHFPMFTGEVFGVTSAVDLSLHNYTVFADLLALPLIPIVGVPAAFNLLGLAFWIATAWGMFALARAITGRAPESWLAGLAFGFSPLFIARSTAHFSLASAAPLPLFALAVHHGWTKGDRRYALLAGAIAGWSAMWDAYYGVFCVLMAAVYLAVQVADIRSTAKDPGTAPVRRLPLHIVDGLLAVMLVAIAVIVVTGGTSFTIAGQRVMMQSLYSPVLIACGLAALRWYLMARPSITLHLPPLRAMAETAGAASIACLVILSPMLLALANSFADGGSFHGQLYWRSSPPGVDLVSLFLPNPNSAWFGGPFLEWLRTQPSGFQENTASLSIVAWMVIGVAVWRYHWRPSRTWTAIALFFGALALGPFLHVAGVNTFIPGPWAFLRYVPVVTATRAPTRYAIVFIMAVAVLFAMALARITAANASRRRLILAVVGIAMVLELNPVPRPLYSATVPSVYKVIADDPRDVRVLALPFGFRSGEWSEGNYTAATQYFQTFHEKGLIGGYLSRISQREIERQHRSFTIGRLVALSEGTDVQDSDLAQAQRRASGFVRRNRLGYVVFETARMSDSLREFAIRVFQLDKVAEADGYELYVPGVDAEQVSVDPSEIDADFEH